LKWSDDENLAWKVNLPGYGQSSPVVWKDRVFLTSVEGDSKETLHVVRLDLATGKTAWDKTFPATNKVKVTDYVSKAPCTPAVNAEHLFALFESGDIFAFDHAGNVKWQRTLTKEYGPFANNHGLGTSPVLAGNTLLVLVAQEKDGYLLAIDTTTGKNRWKADHVFGSSWSTPTVLDVAGKPAAIVSASGAVQAFDVASGKLLWEVDGLKGNTVASPTPAGELVLVGASDRGSQVALRLAGKPDAVRIQWRAEATSSFGSPLVYEGLAFAVSKEGTAFGIDLKTGKTLWDTRLPASTWASPIGGAGRVFFFTRDGTCVVTKAAAEFEELTENKLTIKGRVYGVAAVEGAFVIRTGTSLIRVGK
jgi:outer membrane protein assembly factor BamB